MNRLTLSLNIAVFLAILLTADASSVGDAVSKLFKIFYVFMDRLAGFLIYSRYKIFRSGASNSAEFLHTKSLFS